MTAIAAARRSGVDEHRAALVEDFFTAVNFLRTSTSGMNACSCFPEGAITVTSVKRRLPCRCPQMQRCRQYKSIRKK